MFEAPPLAKLQEALASPSAPIGMRMRAAYYLRQAYENEMKNKDENDDEPKDKYKDEQQQQQQQQQLHQTIDDIVIETLSQGLLNQKHGSLLRHEFAYVMGQLRDERCCPSIEQVLLDDSDCIMVRHECGEALGAIGHQRSLPILLEAIALNPDTPEIGQTCRLAIDYMQWKIKGGTEENDVNVENQPMPMVCACMLSPYSSVDPAPPHPQHVNMSTGEIGMILRDDSVPLFERYRAMFSLRNRGGSEAVLELGRGLLEDESSALFRHEVAYVLGQMQHNASVEALAESLRRVGEHAMVRHESAEALGAIEGRWEDVEVILKTFLEDEDDVIRESAIVALDAADYWGHAASNILSEDVGEGEEERSGLTFVKVKAQQV
jgi:deoxyhypusine monooxygenase